MFIHVIGADSLGALGANAPREKVQWVPGTQKNSDLKFELLTLCYRLTVISQLVKQDNTSIPNIAWYHNSARVSNTFSNHVTLDLFSQNVLKVTFGDVE